MVEKKIVATTPRGIGLYHGAPCRVCGETLRKADKRNFCYGCDKRRRAAPVDRSGTSCGKCGSSEWSRRGCCRQCARAATARYKSSTKGEQSYRRSHLRKRYSTTPEFVDVLLAAQGGVCAICKRDKRQKQRNWHIDHDHDTGAIRGVLCATCNQGLGQFGDSAELLKLAVEYLTGETQPARLWAAREGMWLAALNGGANADDV